MKTRNRYRRYLYLYLYLCKLYCDVTQHCISPGSLNRVSASAGVKAEKSLLHIVTPLVILIPNCALLYNMASLYNEHRYNVEIMLSQHFVSVTLCDVSAGKTR